MRPTYARESHLLYLYQSNVNLIHKTHPELRLTMSGYPMAQSGWHKINHHSLQTVSFPALTFQYKKVYWHIWPKWQKYLYCSLELLKSLSHALGPKVGNLQYDLVYELGQYSYVWNVLLQNIKRHTKPCAFFVVESARCNDLLLWKDVLPHLWPVDFTQVIESL